MMKKLQKLGKALMLPVAALPICGILMGLGYAIAPGVMGVPGAATSGALYNIGFCLLYTSNLILRQMDSAFLCRRIEHAVNKVCLLYTSRCV